MEQPWLQHYDPAVPHHLEHRPTCLQELLPQAARAFPERPALIMAVHAAGRVFRSALTYAQLQERVERFAASLQGLGVRKGDRVALYLPNCPQFVTAYLAVARVGGIAVPFNPLYSAREAEYQLADSGAEVAVVLSPFYGLVKGVQPRTALRHVVVTRIKESFPPLLWALYTVTKERREPKVRLAEGDRWFNSLLAPGAAPTPVATEESDTAVLLYTGGTTGVSKGVELTHRNLVYNAEQNRAWAKLGAGSEVSLAALPLFHAFGLTCSLNLGVLTAATLVLVPDARDIAGLVRVIHAFRPTIFPAVPTLLNAISSYPGLAKFDLRSVRVCPVAGSPLAPAVQRAFVERTGIRACEGYGLSEAAPVVMGNPPFGENRHGTIGLPYPDTQARIVDLETGERPVPFEAGGEWTEPGELVVQGPQVMKGYWGRPAETSAQLRDGWLHTGDIAQMHRDGYFRIVDRLKDMIIRSGRNIYPAEIEAVLAEYPKVKEAAVIGVPDPERGERVKAFVVPRPGARPEVEELLAFCRENLAKYKVPSEIELCSELRLSAVGKPLRRLLRGQGRAPASAPSAPAGGGCGDEELP